MRTWLEHLNMNEELAKVLTKLVIEVKTENPLPSHRRRQSSSPRRRNDYRVKPGPGGG